jgi:hypothetical protein
MAASSSWLGILPASESLLAFTITMNLMFVSVSWTAQVLVERPEAKSTSIGIVPRYFAVMTCSRPSSFLSLRELVVPFVWRIR